MTGELGGSGDANRTRARIVDSVTAKRAADNLSLPPSFALPSARLSLIETLGVGRTKGLQRLFSLSQ